MLHRRRLRVGAGEDWNVLIKFPFVGFQYLPTTSLPSTLRLSLSLAAKLSRHGAHAQQGVRSVVQSAVWRAASEAAAGTAPRPAGFAALLLAALPAPRLTEPPSVCVLVSL